MMAGVPIEREVEFQLVLCEFESHIAQLDGIGSLDVSNPREQKERKKEPHFCVGEVGSGREWSGLSSKLYNP
jgi:hypothetical protein